MKIVPQILFWMAIACIPFAWLIWYVGPHVELVRPVLNTVTDPALKAVLKEAHGERLAIFVALWPVTLLVLSRTLEIRWQEE